MAWLALFRVWRYHTGLFVSNEKRGEFVMPVKGSAQTVRALETNSFLGEEKHFQPLLHFLHLKGLERSISSQLNEVSAKAVSRDRKGGRDVCFGDQR